MGRKTRKKEGKGGKGEEKTEGLGTMNHGNATPWINDRDNGLYGSAGLRVPWPLHKFRCAYNVKLIRRFLEPSRGFERGSSE